jgi:hypothetical protein
VPQRYPRLCAGWAFWELVRAPEQGQVAGLATVQDAAGCTLSPVAAGAMGSRRLGPVPEPDMDCWKPGLVLGPSGRVGVEKDWQPIPQPTGLPRPRGLPPAEAGARRHGLRVFRDFLHSHL